MRSTALIDVDTTVEANFNKLIFFVVVDVFEVELHVFVSQLSEVHVEFSRHEHFGQVLDNWGVDGNLHLEESQDVVDRVESCDGRDTHKVRHVHERLGSEHAELPITRKQSSIF